MMVVLASGTEGSDVSAEVGAIPWSDAELAILESLALDATVRPVANASNKKAADQQAAVLGRRLFFDTRLSRTGTFSCASCHDPNRYFTDVGARSRTLGDTRRHAPSLIGAAYSPWLYWDGSRDSLWGQALTPIERRNELGLARVDAARLVISDEVYSDDYEAVFGESVDLSDRLRFPKGATPLGSEEQRQAWESMTPEDRDLVNRTFSNLGKALAAYERKLVPGPSRFDRYVERLSAEGSETDGATSKAEQSRLSDQEIAGLRLFISDRAQCLRCHNGPMLSNHGFHNTGVPQVDANDPDFGRAKGVEEVLADEFNCLGPYSDAVPEQCPELEFIKRDGEELVAAFKVPSLRNVAETAPYMHTGQYETLREVLEHYNRPPVLNIGHLELSTLHLSDAEIEALEAFLGTLTSEIAADPEWLAPPRD